MLNERELATVLAALRHWQQHIQRTGTAVRDSSHFEDVEPLTPEEIDRLCQRLNTAAPDAEPCECERLGYFCSGVPGILARVENGRLAPGAKVECCDVCCRYPSDEAALAKLRELGIA